MNFINKNVNKMPYSIYPFPNTYFSVLPRELRELLYNYKNTINMTYDVRAYPAVMIIEIKINGEWLCKMTLDGKHMKDSGVLDNIQPFIDFISQEMTGQLPDWMEEGGVEGLDINEIQTLSEFTYRAITLTTYENDMKNNSLSWSTIPLCIQLVVLLQEIHKYLTE